MLSLCKGQTHEVLTGLCLLGPNKKITHVESTRVTFLPLTDEEIEPTFKRANPWIKPLPMPFKAGARFCQKN